MIDEFAGATVLPDHRRLAVCLSVSALLLAICIATINLSLNIDFARLLPIVLEITLRTEPEPEEPRQQLPEPTETLPADTAEEPAIVENTRPVDVQTTVSPASSSVPMSPSQPVDWYEALERAAADIGEQYAKPASLHPEFDELRRIAKMRYSEPQTGKPPPIWENVDEDVYGRTILRRGNCYQVLNDTNLGNRYAFETFERHQVSMCGFSFGKRKPENLPWVEVIRARYQHLRDPDGSQSAAAHPASAADPGDPAARGN